MLEWNVQSTTVSLEKLVNMTEVGDETHKECNSVKESMMGPDHESNPIVKLFHGGYITNNWKKTGDNSMLEDEGAQAAKEWGSVPQWWG